MKPRSTNPSSSATAARRLIVRILRDWEQKGRFARDLLEEALPGSGLSPSDRALVVSSVYGVLRLRGRLDRLIDLYSPRRRPPPASYARQILRLSVFHLREEILAPAPHAVVHQAGELAREFLSRPERAYLNALLRRFSRPDFSPEWPEEGVVDRLAAVHSHPRWLVDRWLKRWGRARTEEICRAGNSPPPVYIRVNRLVAEPRALREKLARAGRSYLPLPGRPNIGVLEPAGSLSELEPFREGWFQVQDPSTLEAVKLLDPRPGELVVDFCASPGGKATYAAEKMGGRGVVLAADRSPERIKLLVENISRLKIACARPARMDAFRPAVALSAADAALLDVPCSNTGVFRRRVDARWRLRPSDPDRLARRAGRMLAAAAGTVKPGGRLVYSTCSIEPEENREVVDGFLRDRKDFVLASAGSALPGDGPGDGYYCALLVKSGEKEVK